MNYGLSFLGTGNYSKTEYSYNNNTYSTNYFAAAFIKFFEIETIYLVVTDEAEKKHFENFKCECNCDDIKLIKIPEGKTEKELWEIFDKIVSSIKEESNIFIDITHGFRSLPFLILPIINFLKTTKKVTIKKIVYGAFEARDQDKNITPVFDLTYFTDMLDWSIAVDLFVNYGNASKLRDKFIDIHKNTYLRRGKYQSRKLASMGKGIDDLSNAMSLNRIKETISISDKLSGDITKVIDDIKNIFEAKPISLFFEIINKRITDFSSNNEGLNSARSIDAQCKLLDYYINTNQYVQGITLCRELIITKICMDMKLDPEIKEKREYISNRLGELSHSDSINKQEPIFKFLQMWKNVTNIRNDIDHAGMRPNPMSSPNAIKNIKKSTAQTQDFIKNKIDTKVMEYFHE